MMKYKVTFVVEADSSLDALEQAEMWLNKPCQPPVDCSVNIALPGDDGFETLPHVAPRLQED